MTPDERNDLARGVAGTVYRWAYWAYRRKVRPVGGCLADLDDLVAAGWCGVAVALNKFDPARGAKFNTHATWWVRSGVSREAGRVCRRLLAANTFSALDDLTGGDRPVASLLTGGGRHPGHADQLLKLLNAAGPAHYRRVLALRYAFGYTQTETARAMGVSRQIVNQIERRALAGCRKRLAREAVAA